MRIAQLKKQKLLLTLIAVLGLGFQGLAQDGGICLEGDCINGFSVKAWNNGKRYKGNFKNGLRDGYGYMRLSDGSIYIGGWKENIKHGHGVYKFPKNHPTFEKYVGQWQKNVREGYGTLHYKINSENGEKQLKIGFWRKNQFYKEVKPSQCLEGDCENGWGTYVNPDKSLYIGEFQNGLRHGQGTLIYRMGSMYKGEFAEGKRSGFGKYYYPSGAKYDGNWAKNKRNGDGRFSSEGKLLYAATWDDGVPKDKVILNEGKDPGQIIDSDDTGTDKEGPKIEILSPKVKRGPIVVAKKKRIRVHGIVTDENKVIRVRVNGVNAAITETVAETRDFEAYIDLAQGQNDFWVEAEDYHGNKTKIDFTVEYDENDDGVVARDLVNAKSNKEAERFALVIGNSTYATAPLRNPVNDAHAIASKLQDYDFDVTTRINVSQVELAKVIKTFGENLKATGGIGLFYYAGHGIQLDGENYLVPIDAEIQKEADIEFESIKLQRVLKEFDFAGNQMNIVILDACRDNPYANLRSLGNGLAPVYRAPIGTFIAYATSPGQAAADGDNNHGLYTQELLNALENDESKKLEDLFKEVRTNVRKKSNNEQVPWENSSLEGDFFFKKN